MTCSLARRHRFLLYTLLTGFVLLQYSRLFCAIAYAEVLGTPVDVSEDFDQSNSTYFVASEVREFDVETGKGTLQWDRHHRQVGLSFNKLDFSLSRAESNEFPNTEYDRDPALPFQISFVSPRTVRLQFSTRDYDVDLTPSLMIDGQLTKDDSWEVEESEETVTYESEFGLIVIRKDPWGIEFRDAEGNLLTRTRRLNDPATFSAPTPFSFVRRARDLGHSTAASFQLAPDEKIFGCGESFTRFDKRGQKVVLYLRDAMGAQSKRMYKPIPFFLSSKGYGMFIHTSTPVTCDFGHHFDSANVLYTGDEAIDIFVFLGEPKEVVSEYTAVTGRSPVPPLWSFGLWMSRITYKSEQEVREVAARLREERIPCDVIHLDTGWFEVDWQCDYQFAESRFENPEQMIEDLRDDGFRISLWQLPYFTSKNRLFPELLEQDLFVKSENGLTPFEDGVLDFTNPDSVAWYEDKLRGLLDLGVAAIKVDFGEDAPLRGLYSSGRTGWYEHNLYPLRYNKVVADLTKEETSEQIIWARSAWAGSQRYPLHWAGDGENSYSAMAATLRAGLSLGMCGFSYWSHDAGGFVERAPRELYRRWLAFAALTSHVRCHGAPPREPWEYDGAFVEDFRRTIEMRYRLLPYLYSQAAECSEQGHPMLRPLFFEFPDDPASWLIEDEYLLGAHLLVAPLFRETLSRTVYLPPGNWIDYQTGTLYQGNQWHEVATEKVPIIVMVREGTVLPLAKVAQSTQEIAWDDLELRAYGRPQATSAARLTLADGDQLAVEVMQGDEQSPQLIHDPSDGKIHWTITTGLAIE